MNLKTYDCAWIEVMALLKMGSNGDRKVILSYIISVGVVWILILCILTATLQGKYV